LAGYRRGGEIRDNRQVSESDLPEPLLSEAELSEAVPYEPGPSEPDPSDPEPSPAAPAGLQLSEEGLPVRQAGRVITVDPARRVLLFRYDDPPPKGNHWSTPGGGLELGEDFYSAARRELLEETGWPDVPVSPEKVLEANQVQYSGYYHGLVRQYDHYFIGRVPDEARSLGEVAEMHTSDGIVEHRWWTLQELDETKENIYPRGLADLVRRFA
jgi:8-oxo-dGTP pyrophosphatase MutT (NUDIX family)